MSLSFPVLISERLTLTQPNETDIPVLVRILNHPVFAENTIYLPHPYTEDNARFWLKLAEQGALAQNHYIWAIRNQEKTELIGGIDLAIDRKNNKAEVGYWLALAHWNNGYMTEALKCVIEFGFRELQLKRIQATHFDTNPASGKVLIKAGMTQEGTLRAYSKKGNNYQNHVMYAIIN